MFAVSENEYHLSRWSVNDRDRTRGNDRNFALIIGINGYDHWPALKNDGKGPEELAKILIKKYNFKRENVELLTNNTKEKPTRENILNTVRRLVIEKADNLLVYYSGYSIQNEKTGEGYWITMDGRKAPKRWEINLKPDRYKWLSHSEISEIMFSSTARAKNVILLVDSNFSKRLLKIKFLPLTKNDLRYEEKIQEKTFKASREVISYGGDEPYISKSTKGRGLFTYYLLKTLRENRYNFMDFENLMFDEKLMFDDKRRYLISAISGSKIVQGRFRKSMDQGGQFVIERLAPLPAVKVVEATVTPEEGFVGDSFMFRVKTSEPAEEVYLEIDGERHLMEGTGIEWHYLNQMNRVGISTYKAVTINEEGKEGPATLGELVIKKIPAKLVNVVWVEASPEKGFAGEEYKFRARTDLPAKGVSVAIGKNSYNMTGFAKEWFLGIRIEDIGNIVFNVAARNEDDVEGGSMQDLIVTNAPPVNVVEAKAGSETGFAGDEFLFTAKTDRSASAVYMKIDGIMYKMEGSGTMWHYKKRITDIGEKEFTVIASNIEDKEGNPRRGILLAKKRLAAIADIEEAIVSPERGFAGDIFVFRVKTGAPAENVVMEMNGESHFMEGSGTEWKYVKRVDRLGISKYKIVAKNEDGREGEIKWGQILTEKMPAKVVDVVWMEASPETGFAGDEYKFKAVTDMPAKEVFISIRGERYEMVGADKEWIFSSRLKDIGTIEYAVVAMNEDDAEGRKMGGLIKIKAPLVNIVEAAASSETGFAGDEFLFTAKTDRVASTVHIAIDNIIYKMEGADTEWWYKKRITDIGKKEFTVIASNIEDKEGTPKRGILLAMKRPAVIADIEDVIVSPERGFAGDTFMFSVLTGARAKEVYIEIDGKRSFMKGSGAEWNYVTQIDKPGTFKYKIAAKNEDDREGKARTGEIVIKKRPAKVVDVVRVEASPETGFAGDEYKFKVVTDIPAKEVFIIIGGKRYDMAGSDKEWFFSRKIEDIGTIKYAAVARNEDGVEGGLKNSAFVVKEKLKMPDKEEKVRFVDNGDGTITDLRTNLMWLKNAKPLFSSLTWKKANEYCKKLESSRAGKGYGDWRLPTIEEWKELIDTTQKNPALPPGHRFSNVVTFKEYWSKSQHKFGPGYAWQVNLWNGKPEGQNKKKRALVWPVRYSKLSKLN
ncbi:MAG: Caspase domain protein [Candidatus Scalindua rubra]|uniref:Caspase domain protein n=1 Tax=Candidatus Scalindua rubra TaxID=1872076 RepID=A0A1E3X4W0_9BACT|nr:MAG: Caspase domain protein [Candidatus Scalindua rubra]